MLCFGHKGRAQQFVILRCVPPVMILVLPLANDLSPFRRLIPRVALRSGRAMLPNCFEFSNPSASLGLFSQVKTRRTWSGKGEPGLGRAWFSLFYFVPLWILWFYDDWHIFFFPIKREANRIFWNVKWASSPDGSLLLSSDPDLQLLPWYWPSAVEQTS